MTKRTHRSLIKVRLEGQQAEVVVELDEGLTPAVEHAKVATAWFRAATGKMGVLQDWTRFEHQGQAFEWRAERASVLTMKPRTVVSVRSPASGESSAMAFDARIEPSVDEAVMTASAGKIALDGDDDDLPDAVVT
jgi:hypothetical protein